MTAEQMRITTNKFCAISSRLARSMADLVSKNGLFSPVLSQFSGGSSRKFRTITRVPSKCLKCNNDIYHLAPS